MPISETQTAITEPDLTGLVRLLARLDPDPGKVDAAYRRFRQSLVKFFAWRGARFPEESTDETIDRLARKLERGAWIEGVRSFALGIARLVMLEEWRSRAAAVRLIGASEAELDRLAAPEPPNEEPQDACLERCLDQLPAGGRELLLEYYAAEGRERILKRQGLARRLDLSESALRNRVQRLRNRIQRSIARCPCQSADLHAPCRRPAEPTAAKPEADTFTPGTPQLQ